MKKKKMFYSKNFKLVVCLGMLLSGYASSAELEQPFTNDKHTVLLMHFDEGRGLPEDASAYKNNAVKNSAKWIPDGKFGGALYFDGRQGFVQIPDSKSLNIKDGELTIEAWIKPDNYTGNYPAIVNKYKGSGGYLVSTHRKSGYMLRFFLRKNDKIFSTIYSVDKLALNKWRHIAAVRYKDGLMALFVNGVACARGISKFDFASDNIPLLIGKCAGYFSGTIDEIRISTIARYQLSSVESQAVTGTVFNDRNKNGRCDDGEGISDVAVSDGVNFSLSDKQGKYKLQTDTANAFVFVINPGGYKLNSVFFKRKNSSPKQTFNFLLSPQKQEGNFSFVQITDTHITTGEGPFNISNGQNILSADLKTINQISPQPAFIVNTGDLGENIPECFRLYNQAVSCSAIPVYNVFGNHDRNSNDDFFDRNYKYFIGPTYYSFNYGQYHFAVINCCFHYIKNKQKVAELEARQTEWLKKDFALNRDKKIIVLQHYSPDPELMEFLSKYNVVAVLSGHRHINNVSSVKGILNISSSSTCFGGIDLSPAGYREINCKDGKISTVSRAFTDNPPASVHHTFTTAVKPEPGADWPMFGHDPEHSFSSGDTVSPPFALCWIKNVGGYIGLAAPVIKNGRLYVGTSGENENHSPAITALDARSGKKLWNTPVDSPVKRNLAAGTKLIYGVSVSGKLYALDPVSGKIIWEKSDGIAGLNYCAPVIVDGKLYINGFSAFDSETGRRIWHSPVKPKVPGYLCSPAVSNGKIYVSFTGWNNPLFCLDAQNGDVIWQSKVMIQSPPLVSSTLVYAAGEYGMVYALDAQDGKVVWQKKVGAHWMVACPVLSGDLLYVSCPEEGKIIALDVRAKGAPVWEFQTGRALVSPSGYRRGGSQIVSSPAVSGEIIYLAAVDGFLYALNKKNGKKLWSYNLGAPAFSAPVVSGKMLYVLTYDGNIFAFAENI
ncbi:MAG: PQQ-binding-like beta-propeller repeat protein [Victivallaceae bacterium]|nr:PQQ-binding-like beta-propeller repeat protein [Victivallaceae bacterium]